MIASVLAGGVSRVSWRLHLSQASRGICGVRFICALRGLIVSWGLFFAGDRLSYTAEYVNLLSWRASLVESYKQHRA